MVYAPGKLIVKGKVLDRTGKPKFRYAFFDFLSASYDAENEALRVPERVEVPMQPDGSFRVELFPSSNGEAWVAMMTFVATDGKPYKDARVLPAEGEVDYFACAVAEHPENVIPPEGHTPVLVSDFNKPGGPLQLTDRGTIGAAQMPGEFLRIDDERLPDLELVNYLTHEEYEADQNRPKEYAFTESMKWEVDHGLGYRPLVECVQSDGTALEGSVAYPVGTTKVTVEWDAPTSGTMILR